VIADAREVAEILAATDWFHALPIAQQQRVRANAFAPRYRLCEEEEWVELVGIDNAGSSGHVRCTVRVRPDWNPHHLAAQELGGFSERNVPLDALELVAGAT
jgi:hypothetical protein